ncbi:SdrD B-like domain-containing protein, partial [Spirosoma terrae]
MATSSTQLQRFLYLVARLLLVYLILGFVSSFSASAQVSGVVFRDFNANGTRETLEVGVASVTVTATFSGTIATTVSTTTGAYSFNAATIPSGTAVRLEFRSNIANEYSGPVTTTASGSNRSSVQFVTAGAGTTTANYAVNQPSDYCQANPDLITACYVNGATAGTGIDDVIVKWPYSNSGTSTTGKSTISTKNQSGQTWGLAFDRNQKKIYAAAFLKRHAGLLDNNADGFGDLGAIYQIDPATSVNNLWLDLTTLGVNVGSIGNDAARGLSNTGAPNNDPTSYSLVGQVGLGDIDLSDDNTTMYVVSLNQQELVVIDIATKALLGKYTIPNPGCTGGSPRPFGVKYYRGAVYVGVVCDAATSQLKNNLSATVYRFNGSSFTSVLTFPLTYPKGIPIISSCPNQTGWYPWVATLPAPCEDNAISYPQPILSDIEFDTDGAMILGFIDRNAHQGGWRNYGPTGNTLYFHVNAGDVLRAALVNGNFVLENGGVAGTLTGNTTNNQGPGGGEFYQGDNFSNVVNVPHEETSLGGLALIPGRGEVAVTSMDPVNEGGTDQFSSGGVIFLSNTNGSKQRSFRVYSRNDLGTFGKAAGLGDIEALCDPAPIQIGNRVWRDNNRNGIQDPGEPAIPGAVVTLYDATGTTAIASVTTNAAGEYYFSSTTLTTGTSTSSVATSALVPNTNYALVVTSLGTSTVVNGLSLSSVSPMTPGEATSANSGSTTTNNDALSVGGRPTIQLTTGPPGSVNHTYDFGFVIPGGNLGDFVWEDANRNGQQDAGEPGISNVTVSLLSSGTVVATTTTNASGLYSFTGLTPGVPYSVSFTAPAGYSATLQNIGSDVTDSDGNPVTGLTGVYSLTANEFNPTVDMGYYRPASLGDFVWVDVNQNGQQDIGEPGLPGVVVTLLDGTNTPIASTTTNASGLYSFTGLTPGVPYSVSFTTPTNYTATLANVGNDLTDSDPVGGVTAPVTLTSGENNTNVDAGFILRVASLGDFVFEDANRNGQQDVGEPGIPGVTVTLLSSGTLVATTTTNASGLYSFTGLTPGVPYSVSFTAPAGYSATLQNIGSDLTDSDGNPVTGLTGVYSLTANEFNPTVDMGYYRPASLGDFVWVDVNQNGQQDIGEPGLPGVVVTLLDGTNTLIASTTTNASGLYSFTGLTPGVPYSVSFTTPANYTATLSNVGNDLTDSDPVGGVTAPVTLTSGENNTSLDAGFLLRVASLGDFVWEDANRNGQQDVGELGIPGVTVSLLSSGTLVATTTTNASGLYSFTGLTPGVPYSVSFTAPAGYSATLQNIGNDLTDSDGNPVTGLTGVYSLTANEFNPTVDMGYYRPASLGDFVWVDVNQNGQQDAGEPGLPGVVVTLLDGTNTPIASTTTNASGLYSFTGLTPGVPYSVSFTTPTNYTATLANVGNDLTDS